MNVPLFEFSKCSFFERNWRKNFTLLCLDFSLQILSRAKKLSWYLCTKSKKQHVAMAFSKDFARNNLLCNFYLYLDDIVAQLGMKFTFPFSSFLHRSVHTYLILTSEKYSFYTFGKKGFPFSSLLTSLCYRLVMSQLFWLYLLYVCTY